jgi:integrase
MARPRKPYFFYRRKTQKNKNPIYYVTFRTPEGERTYSTGETTLYGAEKWARQRHELLTNEQYRERELRENITFSDFAGDFWEPKGNFAEGRRARLRTITPGYLDNCRGTTKAYLVPKWGAFKLKDITATMIDEWVLSMVKDPVPNLTGKKEGVRFLAPATINKILQVLRTILEQAVTEGYIRENPAKYIKPVSNRTAQQKGVLTPKEVKALLNPGIWPDFRHYAINLLSLTTGMRMSEVRGLLVEQVHEDYVAVHTAWADRHGLKEPKWGSMRDIPITRQVYEVLHQVIENTRPQSIVFYSERDYDKPMAKSFIEKHLYNALDKIGIDDEKRKERNLTFHSHRHTLNTLLRTAGVPDPKIRMMTGHRQQSMTELYTHFRKNDFKEIAEATIDFIP